MGVKEKMARERREKRERRLQKQGQKVPVLWWRRQGRKSSLMMMPTVMTHPQRRKPRHLRQQTMTTTVPESCRNQNSFTCCLNQRKQQALLSCTAQCFDVDDLLLGPFLS